MHCGTPDLLLRELCRRCRLDKMRQIIYAVEDRIGGIRKGPETEGGSAPCGSAGRAARWYALWYPGPTVKRIVQEMQTG